MLDFNGMSNAEVEGISDSLMASARAVEELRLVSQGLMLLIDEYTDENPAMTLGEFRVEYLNLVRADAESDGVDADLVDPEGGFAQFLDGAPGPEFSQFLLALAGAFTVDPS